MESKFVTNLLGRQCEAYTTIGGGKIVGEIVLVTIDKNEKVILHVATKTMICQCFIGSATLL